MTDRPQVTSADVLASGDGAEEPPAGRGRRTVALALAAGLGFAAAQLVSPSASGGASAASLALVTGRSPHLERTAGEPLLTGMEVVLVNTGPTALRLDRAEVDGSRLVWDVDRPLQPGQQVAAALREERPCDGPLDALSGPKPAPRLRVRSHDAQTGDRLPDVLLALPPTVGRIYDDHVRTTCALPRLHEALDPVTGRTSVDGADVVVPLELSSRSVLPLHVVDVVSTVPGLGVRLTGEDGQPVRLPLTVPGSTRTEIVEGIPYDDGASMRYRLRLAPAAGSCKALVAGSGVDVVVVRYVDPAEPDVVARRGVHLDLTPLVRDCGPHEASPPR